MTVPFKKVYQFKVTLKGIRPPVWRRIQVPGSYTFWDLHVAVQDAMGWFDEHLHAFHVRNPKTGKQEEIGIPDAEGWSERRVFPGWERKISRYLSEENPKALYVYDFGDDWAHDVKLEKILPREKGIQYPLCLKGKRACPPEDCGGVPGYQDLLEILADPDHEEYEETLEWVGEDFDPEDFDPRVIDFWDPRERLEMMLSGEGDPEETGDDDDLDEDGPWLTRDYFMEILKLAEKGDLDDLDPEERRVAEIMLEHKEELAKDLAYADDYPEEEGAEEDAFDPFLHITIHTVVESQLAERDPIEAVQFYDAMRRQGCPHHDAVHLIGTILVPLMFASMIEERSFDLEAYRGLLKEYRKSEPERIPDLLEKDPRLFPEDG